MMKYIISVAVLLMLAGTGLATMWIYDDPMFFQMNYPSKAASFNCGGHINSGNLRCSLFPSPGPELLLQCHPC